MKVTITEATENSKNYSKKIEFPSLRAALEWAKANNKTELNLIKIIIKKP